MPNLLAIKCKDMLIYLEIFEQYFFKFVLNIGTSLYGIKMKGILPMKKTSTLVILGLFIASFCFLPSFANTTTQPKVQKEGLKQGLKNGAQAGAKDGLKYGAKDGLKYGLKNGLKNGAKNGQVNGPKK